MSKMSLEEATIKELYQQLEDDKQVEDVQGLVDDILVVTDPEINTEEYEEVIDRAQELVEDTPEGEIPFDESYIGQYLQTCPICGGTFIEDHLLEPGATCPICNEQPDAFVMVGQIKTEESVAEDNGVEIPDEEEETEIPSTPLDTEENEEENEFQREVASEQQQTADNKLEENKDLFPDTFINSVKKGGYKPLKYCREVGDNSFEEKMSAKELMDIYNNLSNIYSNLYSKNMEDKADKEELYNDIKYWEDRLNKLHENKEIKEEDVSVYSIKDIIANAKNDFQINGAIHTLGYVDSDLSNDLRLMYNNLKDEKADIDTIKGELLSFIPVNENKKVTENVDDNKLQEVRKTLDDVYSDSATEALWDEKFKELVPKEGKAETTIGEIMRNYSSLSHALLQNGDIISRLDYQPGYYKNAEGLYDAVQELGDSRLVELLNKMWDTRSESAYEHYMADFYEYFVDNYLKKEVKEEPLTTEINESKSSEEEELAKLQTELRGVNVSELSEEEYKEYKDKSNRVQELINKLYNIRKLGEDINLDSQWDSEGINIKGWHLEEQESDQTGIIRHWLYNRQGLGGALTIYPDTIKELEDYIQKDKQIFGFEGGYIDPKVKEEIIKLIKNGKIKLSNRVQESVKVKTEAVGAHEYIVQGASDVSIAYNTVDDLMQLADIVVDEIMDITGESEEDIAMYLEEQGRDVTGEDEGNCYLITDGDNEYYVSYLNESDMESLLDELIDYYLEYADIDNLLDALQAEV